MEQMWTLLPDRKTVRLQLPGLPIAGIPEPLDVHMDFDVGTVEEMIDRLLKLRAQMLPPLPRASWHLQRWVQPGNTPLLD